MCAAANSLRNHVACATLGITLGQHFGRRGRRPRRVTRAYASEPIASARPAAPSEPRFQDFFLSQVSASAAMPAEYVAVHGAADFELSYFEAMAMREPAPFNETAATERDYYREDALFKGNMPLLVGILNTSSFIHFRNTDKPEGAPSARRLRASLKKRQLLLAIESFEGWVVSVSRWIIQAASTLSEAREATTIRGKAHGLLKQCSARIRPSVDKLIRRVREAGVVRRTDVAKALAQCAAHHKLWSSLVHRGASANEANRFGWRPLHYAAAIGSKQLVTSPRHSNPQELPQRGGRRSGRSAVVAARGGSRGPPPCQS